MSSHLACLSLLALSLGAGALRAQPGNIFTAATPDVEAALRARITAFYEAQKDGKWREAQKFVADDAIDSFLEHDKTRHPRFEIRDVKWIGEGFKEASVTMIVPFEMYVQGVGKIEAAPRPINDHWRLEDGTWLWFVPKVDPCAPFDTPVGRMTPECKDGKPVGDPQSDATKALRKMIEQGQVKPENIQGRVSASANQVRMAAQAAGEQTVTIKNDFDGPVTLELIGGRMPGLAVTFDGAPPETPGRITVKTKESATLRLKFQPGDNRPPDRLGMQVRVDPLSTMLPVDVLFAAN